MLKTTTFWWETNFYEDDGKRFAGLLIKPAGKKLDCKDMDQIMSALDGLKSLAANSVVPCCTQARVKVAWALALATACHEQDACLCLCVSETVRPAFHGPAHAPHYAVCDV